MPRDSLPHIHTALKQTLLKYLHATVRFVSREDLISSIDYKAIYQRPDEYRFPKPPKCHFFGFSAGDLSWKPIVDNYPSRAENHYHWMISPALLMGETATAVDYRTGKVILETVFGIQDYFTRSGDLKYYLTRSVRRIEQTIDYALVLTNCLARNYYHWSLEILPLLNCYDEICKTLGNKVTLIVPNKLPRFAREQILLLGIDEQFVVEWKFKQVLVKNLIVPQYYRSNDAILPIFSRTPFSFLKRLGDKALESLQKTKGAKPRFPTRIYISRKDRGSRNIVNAEDLLGIVAQYGCVEVDVEDLDFKEQVELFANADFIMTVTGAALVNLIYCKKPCTVVELCPRSWGVGAFYQIAAHVNLVYYLLCLEPLDEHHNSQLSPEHLQFISKILRDVNDGNDRN